LPDAPSTGLRAGLGSVRQLTDALAQSFDPYGGLLSSQGSAATPYGYAGEWGDSYIKLICLRSRMYSPATGRFLTKDSWQGNYTRPLSLKGWNYVEANPINLLDPSGHWVIITEVSREWNSADHFSPWNWVRIFNPFDNETEYYWWDDFGKSWKQSAGYKMLLVKPLPQKENCDGVTC
jgi:RHS repeat-associated protein